MNTYRITEDNNMAVDSSKNRKLYYDIEIDDNKDCESYSDDMTADKYDESLIKDIIEKYLANKEKVMSEYEDRTESEAEEDEEADVLSSTEYENESVKDLGRVYNELIINSAMESYKNEFGEYPSLDILREGLLVAKAGLFNDLTDDEFEDMNEFESENVLEFSNELEDALMIASDIGGIDQEYLVNRIMDTYHEINDKECSLDELKLIFCKIKTEFEKEANEELLDLIEICDSDDDSDDDYIITKKDIMQAVLDDTIDLQSESDDTSGESEQEIEESEFYQDKNNVAIIGSDSDDDDEDDSDYQPEFDTQDYTGDYQLYQ